MAIWLIGHLGLQHCVAELVVTNKSSSLDMETNIVGQAMVLIRSGSYSNAIQLLMPAAERGESEPQALLGQIYNAGWGVPVNYELAFTWWSRAAASGSTDGQWGLGVLYDEGLGVAKDAQKAAQLWRKASEAGNIKATINLAFLYEEGRGVKTDLAECARLLKIAAESGEPAAQLNYGLKLIHGEGVSKDTSLGCAWLAIAAESPRTKGTRYGEQLAAPKNKYWNELSPPQREKADTLKKEILSRIKVD